jgi:sterol 14-demethylase
MARDGPLEAIREQQAKLGSVFTASAPLGLFKVTFLIGSEVSSHFYVAPDSEISMGRLYEFTVPIFGPGHWWRKCFFSRLVTPLYSRFCNRE